jgi:hypothetical protein
VTRTAPLECREASPRTPSIQGPFPPGRLDVLVITYFGAQPSSCACAPEVGGSIDKLVTILIGHDHPMVIALVDADRSRPKGDQAVPPLADRAN